MNVLSRAGLALVGLALATPAAVLADPPASSGSNPHNHRRGLFGRQKLCAECQRAKLQAQGINVPPPPPIPNGVVGQTGECTACQAAAGQGQGVIITESAPGYAVVGGDSAPGYAVVGGQVPTADPAPIGSVQPSPNRIAAAGRPATGDRSVMPASIPAPEPVAPARSNRPRVLSHLFGLSEIGSSYREEKQRRRGQEHASIRYDQEAQKVNEIPASMVYGRKGAR